MLEVIHSVCLQGRTVAFVSWAQLTELPPFKLGAVLVDGSGRRFVLTGLSSPRGGEPVDVALVLRPVDGKQGALAGSLQLAG